MKINYNNKRFRAESNSDNGEVDDAMIFEYFQEGNILYCNYSGANILKGQLLGIVDEEAVIQMTYQQINSEGKLRMGKCTSTPVIQENGKIKLLEKWQWTNGDLSEGESVLVEV